METLRRSKPRSKATDASGTPAQSCETGFSEAEKMHVEMLWQTIGVVATARLLGSSVPTIDSVVCTGWVRPKTIMRIRAALQRAFPVAGAVA